MRKTRPLRPRKSWPPEACKLYWNFYEKLSLRVKNPHLYMMLLNPFFRYQEEQGLSFRELPQSLITSYVEQKSIYFRRHVLSGIRLWLRFLFQRKELLYPLHEELPQYPNIQRKRVLLSHQQVLQVLQLPQLDEPVGLRDRAFLEMAYGNGMRRGELAALNLADIDMTSWLIHIGEAKNSYQRTVPMTRHAREFLVLYLREARPQLASPLSPKALWLNRYGRRMSSANIGSRLDKVYRVQETLGFTVTLHQLRHACATHLIDGGASLRAVQELLGHRSLENTKIYTHVTATRLQAVHDRCHPRNNGRMVGI